MNHIAASFAADSSVVRVGPNGQIGHEDTIDHTAQFERTVHKVRDGVWSVVGNGLSNQNFVEGPEGLIAIDTGESIQEMQWSLDALRVETDAPVVAIVYTHSHYVGGTAAIPGAGDTVPIWGHERIGPNRERTGVELSASATRGAVHQFGLFLAPDGPDGLVNVGLGESFRRADHAPHEIGFVPPTELMSGPVTITLAGLQVEMTPAPSDADDSVTIWFPELSTAVHNIAWPVLFNVFAIRGEEYRDPRILLQGLDHLLDLGAEHLVGAHGVPLSGADEVRREVTLDRDSIQFMWDQTVRGVNRDLSGAELGAFVQLPERYSSGRLTRQLYGLAEHHVRQIHHGLVGWFDGDEANLFPLDPRDRANRMVIGFGGAETVRGLVRTAIDANDLRWAVEMATWLARADGATDGDRGLLAEAIRTIGQRTTAANIRNWCLTRARELEGSLDLDRLRTHVFGRAAVLAAAPATTVHALRVLLDPEAASDLDDHLRWHFSDDATAGLHVRNQVAVPTDGADADLEISLDLETWAEICSGRTPLQTALDDGRVTSSGDRSRIDRIASCFDHPSFRG
jgi:alkyl sulfatase BDS1-like metallo-beta-lactamase superfamily hydrolase